MARRRIAILVHERDGRPFTANYVARALRRIWRRQGHEVRVIRGPGGPVNADVLLMHVDLSVVPPEYLRFAEQFPVVLNRTTGDISKRVVSESLVTGPDDAWDGPVIVKTNLNCGGVPEQVATRPLAAAWGRLRRVFHPPVRDLARAGVIDPHRYPVFPSVAAVPREAFENRDLVVERFLPEREGDLYCVRVYLFLGDRALCTRRLGPNPVVKEPAVVHREDAKVPPAIEAVRRRLGFDFGKFDFVIHDGRSVLLDVSRTPVFGGLRATAAQRQRAEVLAGGLAPWLA